MVAKFPKGFSLPNFSLRLILPCRLTVGSKRHGWPDVCVFLQVISKNNSQGVQIHRDHSQSRLIHIGNQAS
jgi:hypothetical protein